MNVQNFHSLHDIYGISKNFKLDMRKRNTIRLNESMLNRIIKESVKNVLNEMEEATNGWTEQNFARLNGLNFADKPTKQRLKRAKNYLAHRWQRENGYSNSDIDKIAKWDDFDESTLTSNQLRHLSNMQNKGGGKNGSSIRQPQEIAKWYRNH